MFEVDRKVEDEYMNYSYESRIYEKAKEKEEQFISNLFDELAEE